MIAGYEFARLFGIFLVVFLAIMAAFVIGRRTR